MREKLGDRAYGAIVWLSSRMPWFISVTIVSTVYLADQLPSGPRGAVVLLAMLMLAAVVGGVTFIDGLDECEAKLDKARLVVPFDVCASPEAQRVNRMIERLGDDCDLVCKPSKESEAPM